MKNKKAKSSTVKCESASSTAHSRGPVYRIEWHSMLIGKVVTLSGNYCHVHATNFLLALRLSDGNFIVDQVKI